MSSASKNVECPSAVRRPVYTAALKCNFLFFAYSRLYSADGDLRIRRYMMQTCLDIALRKFSIANIRSLFVKVSYVRSNSI